MTQSALINVMSQAAIKAGKGLMRDFGEVDQLQISKKGASNFVTSADIRTEKLLQKELSKARPDYGFLLEEAGEVPGKDPEWRWIIDPLDGTSNFIHAVPYFCISIGLERRFGPNMANSEIVAGVIFDPIHNELFTAERYRGAYLNNRRLQVSTRDNLEDAMLVTGNPRHSLTNEGHVKALCQSIAGSNATLRFFGATALDLANLAAGRFDACWYYTTQPWDIAAGMLMVQEAGGIIGSLTKEPAQLYAGSFFASNKPLAPSVHKLVAKAA